MSMKLVNKGGGAYAGQEKIDLNKVTRTEDGAVILNGYPLRAGNYDYLDYELNAGWDGKVIVGHITEAEAARVAATLKGVPLTYDHVFLETLKHREEHGIGAIISDGELQDDGRVKSQVMITNADAIAKFSTQEFNQLSIGFTAEIDGKNAPEGADFLLTNIRVNHVALVEFGRAGAGGSLANSKSKNGDKPMETKELQAKIESLTLENSELKNSKNEVERLKAENDMLKNAQVTEAQIELKAVELANTWQELGAKIVDMTGEASTVSLSNASAAMKAALIKAGHSLPDDASDVYVASAFDFALSNNKTKAAPLDVSVGIGSLDDSINQLLGVK